MPAEWLKLPPKRRTQAQYEEAFANVALDQAFNELMVNMNDTSNDYCKWSAATRGHRKKVNQRFGKMHTLKYQQFQRREYAPGLIIGERHPLHSLHAPHMLNVTQSGPRISLAYVYKPRSL